MKSNPIPENIDFFNLFNELDISKEALWDIAFDTKLIKRRRTIHPTDLLHALCMESLQGTVSHNDLAAKIESGSGTAVSKVAIWKKINKYCLDFLKKVFGLVIQNKFSKNRPLLETPLFKRIIVQDSTIIRLPQRLFEEFSGVANGHSIVCNSRIQCVYDLVSEQFLSFSVDGYSKTDYEAAPELVLEKGDLTLRDRGYLIADEIQRHIDQEADCIYRHKYKLALLDTQNEKTINLLGLLQNRKHVDMMVKLNNKDKTVIRLLATPVSKEIADERRRKAKKELKKTPPADYLELLGWSIFLTTVPKETADIGKVFGLYKLRWRIEIIFKSWKSNMSFSRIHNVSKIQLWVILWSRFIMIIICTQLIYTPCRAVVKANSNNDLSLIKVIHYLIRNLQKMILILKELMDKNQSHSQIYKLAKYCSYDKRIKRTHYQIDMQIIYT